MADLDQGTKVRRTILEQLPEAVQTSPAKPFVDFMRLPVLKNWAHDFVLDQLEILEHEGRVELRQLPDRAACAVKLTPLGLKSLQIPEEEWQQRVTSPVVHAPRIEISNSQVGNVAQVSGSPESPIQQASTSSDLVGVYAAIDRLVDAVRNSASVSDATKNDASIEGDQLKGELRRSQPSPNRIQQALGWFKSLDRVVEIGAHVVALAEKLKGLLPGTLSS